MSVRGISNRHGGAAAARSTDGSRAAGDVDVENGQRGTPAGNVVEDNAALRRHNDGVRAVAREQASEDALFAARCAAVVVVVVIAVGSVVLFVLDVSTRDVLDVNETERPRKRNDVLWIGHLATVAEIEEEQERRRRIRPITSFVVNKNEAVGP